MTEQAGDPRLGQLQVEIRKLKRQRLLNQVYNASLGSTLIVAALVVSPSGPSIELFMVGLLFISQAFGTAISVMISENIQEK